MDEEEEKSAMWRVPASLVRLVDAVAVEIEADPTLRAEAGTKAGKVTRAGVLRLLVSRGATSMQGTIRERKKLEAAAQAAVLAATAPAPVPVIPARKPKKGAGK